MNASDHLTSNQISRFAAKALPSDESRTVGGHLLRCIDCRDLLPLPDSKQFLSAIASENDFGRALISSGDPSSAVSPAQALAGLFTKPTILAWGLGVLVVIFGLAALSVLRIPNERRVEAEVAQNTEIAPSVLTPNDDEREVAKNPSPDSLKDSSPINNNIDKPASFEKRKIPKTKVDTRVRPAATARSQGVVASVRGATEPCAEERTVVMELESQKAELVLKWKPVPKAAKYHLYISDDNEILVDEVETKSDTSYVLTKALSPAKSYKWKIVITLNNGNSLYSDAKKFSANDFQSRSELVRSRGKANTRCLAN